MGSVPRSVGTLAGVVAFCAALLTGLLRQVPPMAAARRAALCALALTVLAWLCAHVALSVVHDGVQRDRRDGTV